MAYVLTSLSGNLISAASAGYAPTNGADVSAIASAYATGNYVEKSATEVAIGSANIAETHALSQGINNTAKSNSFAQGLGNLASSNSFAQGMTSRASSYSFAQGYCNTASSFSFAQGTDNLAKSASFAQGSYNRATSYSFAQGYYSTAKNTAAVFGQYNLRGDGDTTTGDSAAFAIGDGTASDARHDLMLVTKDGEITMYSSTADTVGTGIMSSIRAISAAATGGGVTGDYLTSKVGSGQATFTTAFQDGMDKRPTLMIEAQRSAGSKMYPRMIITDWNDTTGDTHSGALLSNAFEFYICPQSARGEVAPSGIAQSRLDASRLQFNVDPAVSSFTMSSEFTRSGMKLGLSGNSASWVAISGNGTSGGFITLDDGSGTSGRIVASSAPYWNGKQDALIFDWDSTSAISSINGSALAGGGGTQVQSDWTESATADPSYIQNKPTIMGMVAGSNVTITEGVSSVTIAATVPTAGNMLSVTNNTLNVNTTVGLTDIQQVNALPAQPVATVLYLIPET